MSKKCPGKVLICGGHLILDPGQKGVCFPFPNACISSNCSIRCLNDTFIDSKTITLTQSNITLTIAVHPANSSINPLNFKIIAIFKDIQFSPFDTSTFHVVILQSSSNGIKIMEGDSVVPFSSTFASIELGPIVPFEKLTFRSLVVIFWFISNYEKLNNAPYVLELESFSDSAFYINPPRDYYFKNKAPIWNKPISELNKSGLGTSAAYVSSLVLALASSDYSFNTLLAQALLVHWIGQRCKGSGFDICVSLINALEPYPVCLIFSQSDSVLKLLPIVANSLRSLLELNLSNTDNDASHVNLFSNFNLFAMVFLDLLFA